MIHVYGTGNAYVSGSRYFALNEFLDIFGSASKTQNYKKK